MTKKSTKSALFTSSLALLLCFAMLVGTTFAWFTDSVTSSGNIITAGTLKVGMYWADGKEDPAAVTWADASQGAIFDYANWEPGYTQVRHIKIANEGTLALKYQLAIAANGNVSALSDVIDVYYADPAVQVADRAALANATKIGTLTEVLAGMASTASGNLEATENHTITLALKMQEAAGNEYQGLSIGSDFKVILTATQLTSERDSFDNQYDVDAEYDVVVASKDELATAIADAEDGAVIALANDVFVDTKLTVASGKDVVLDLGGNELSGAFTQQGVSALIENKGTLTIKNGSLTSLATNPDTDWNPEGFPTYASNTISNSGVLVIENGAVIENQTNVGGASYAIDNYAGGTLTINGGEIKALDTAIRLNTASTSAANNVTINGGNITGKRAIWVHIAGSNSAQAPEVNLTINGGDFNSTSDFTLYSYSYGQSFANVKVTFNGGDFEKYVAFGGGYKGDQETVVVNGGVFHAGIGRYLADDSWEDITTP